MPTLARSLCLSALVCLLSAFASAEADPPIVANQNRVAAGSLANGTLTLHLEIRSGAWHPEAEDGPTLYVEAFGEEGKPAQIPGPLVRVQEGTTIHVSVKNTLASAATVYGFVTRPGDPKVGMEIKAGETAEATFVAGTPGTYFYWARTEEYKKPVQPYKQDAQLNGAFIVDAPGPVVPDRVIVMDQMFALSDVTHPTFEVLALNGKLYPFTEPLEYTQGETIRWRVINPSCCEHPMHLHGSFFQILSIGSFAQETAYEPNDRQSVVTQTMKGGSTMMMEWTPRYAGLWLFHCHLHAHISNEERLPYLLENVNAKPPAHEMHEGMSGMSDMAGLVLAIRVKPVPNAIFVKAPTLPVHKIDLVAEPNAANAKLPAFACSVRDGKKLVAAADKSMGPPIIVTRGEPVEITVLNHLKQPTTIHWHGIELESYYDGVMGGGTANQVTPAIEPGGSFTARFTPPRAGTFIYHTHSMSPEQLTDGVYGALIVLNPGESYDAEHDRVFVIGTRDADFYAKRLTLNGAEQPSTLTLQHGTKYRIRVINIAPELFADLQLASGEKPTQWRAIAKDGADLPARLVVNGDAKLHILSGETYDYEFQPTAAGDLSLQVSNSINDAKVVEKIVVQ